MCNLKVFAVVYVLLQHNPTEINIFRRLIKLIFFEQKLRKLPKFALSTEVLYHHNSYNLKIRLY